jgi:hypothetical protein
MVIFCGYCIDMPNFVNVFNSTFFVGDRTREVGAIGVVEGFEYDFITFSSTNIYPPIVIRSNINNMQAIVIIFFLLLR